MTVTPTCWTDRLRASHRARALRAGGLLALGVLLLVAQGCAAGQKVDYLRETRPELRAAAGLSLALGVQDQRSYILSGEKKPHYVGASRGGFGNAFAVTTRSGKPLASDVAQVVERAITRAAGMVTVVPLEPSDTPEQVLAKLRAAGAPRVLWISIVEWKSDSYASTWAYYDLVARGYDSSGTELGRSTVQGKTPIQAAGGIHSVKDDLPRVYGAQLAALLNDPQLDRVLR